MGVSEWRGCRLRVEGEKPFSEAIALFGGGVLCHNQSQHGWGRRPLYGGSRRTQKAFFFFPFSPNLKNRCSSCKFMLLSTNAS